MLLDEPIIFCIGDKYNERYIVVDYYIPSNMTIHIADLDEICKDKNLDWLITLKVENDTDEDRIDTAKNKGKERLYWVMQTICSCGLRVSELKFITVEALKKRQAEIKCKGKIRQVCLPANLCKQLGEYIKKRKIKSGPVFVSKTGRPLDRSNIWGDMKRLCASARVSPEKVYPHNLRHLFAHTFYSLQKDIVRLADVLGHSNINTTRVYTMETGEHHRRIMQKLGLVMLLC